MGNGAAGHTPRRLPPSGMRVLIPYSFEGFVESHVRADPSAVVLRPRDHPAMSEQRVRLKSVRGDQVELVDVRVEPAGAFEVREEPSSDRSRTLIIRSKGLRPGARSVDGQVRCRLADGNAVLIPVQIHR